MVYHPLCSVIVILGWILDKPMTLLFDPYESIAFFFSGATVSTSVSQI
jgi:Ca2+:H+ antiporter